MKSAKAASCVAAIVDARGVEPTRLLLGQLPGLLRIKAVEVHAWGWSSSGFSMMGSSHDLCKMARTRDKAGPALRGPELGRDDLQHPVKPLAFFPEARR
jgi:hypothetical protein